MQSSFTPGPWRAEPTGPWDGWDGWEVVAKDGATVCNGLGSQREPIRAANARLIASAPELLEALQEMVDYYGSASANVEALHKARAVIAKATGGAA